MPDDLSPIFRALCEALYGPRFAHGDVARLLGWTDPSRVGKLLRGERPVRPGQVADLAAAARSRAADLVRLADEADAAVGALHGLTRRDLALIGWLTSGRALIDPDWLRAYRRPAEALASIVSSEARDASGVGEQEAERLARRLAALSDQQALDIEAAARDVDDLTSRIPED